MQEGGPHTKSLAEWQETAVEFNDGIRVQPYEPNIAVQGYSIPTEAALNAALAICLRRKQQGESVDKASFNLC